MSLSLKYFGDLVPNHPSLIAGDWGTSHLRLFLCDGEGRVLDRADGPGIGSGQERPSALFSRLTAAWPATVPAMLCGMVGSSIGWREAPYFPCPAGTTGLARGALRFEENGRSIAICPGLSCDNPLGAPDRMRGEETQILGALLSTPELAKGHHLLCLPGTHTKWASVQDGKIERFLTAFSGETFDLLCRHSVLVRPATQPKVGIGPAFLAGVDNSDHLIHRLFEARSRQLSGEYIREEAVAHLSGLLLGNDVSGALALLPTSGRVAVIGGAGLAALYGAALNRKAAEPLVIDGEQAVLRGLTALYKDILDEH